MKRFASTRSENRARQPGPGAAQCSRGSIDEVGIRYGLTTHGLDREHDRDRADDRHEPVERDRPRVRQPAAARSGSSSGDAPEPALLEPPLVDLPVVAREQHVGHASSRGTPRAACSAGTRRRARAPRRSSRARSTPRSRARRAATGRRRRRAPSPAGRRSRARTGRSRSRRTRGCATIRSSNPSKRADRSVSRSSPASSSTTSCVSCRPRGVIATTRWSGAPP